MVAFEKLSEDLERHATFSVKGYVSAQKWKKSRGEAGRFHFADEIRHGATMCCFVSEHFAFSHG